MLIFIFMFMFMNMNMDTDMDMAMVMDRTLAWTQDVDTEKIGTDLYTDIEILMHKIELGKSRQQGALGNTASSFFMT
jgi:hypothetical protein